MSTIINMVLDNSVSIKVYPKATEDFDVARMKAVPAKPVTIKAMVTKQHSYNRSTNKVDVRFMVFEQGVEIEENMRLDYNGKAWVVINSIYYSSTDGNYYDVVAER